MQQQLVQAIEAPAAGNDLAARRRQRLVAPVESRFDVKAGAAAAEKGRIAAAALKLLAPDDTIYLDSGSTVLALARLLHGWTRLTVVPNSLPVATELVGRGPRLIVLGGELRATSRAVGGART